MKMYIFVLAINGLSCKWLGQFWHKNESPVLTWVELPRSKLITAIRNPFRRLDKHYYHVMLRLSAFIT